MGNTFEVHGWASKFNGSDEFQYYELYRGESLLRCLWIALTSRRYYGCVKVLLR